MFVFLSPATGEPLAFHTNHRPTVIRALNATTVISSRDGSNVQKLNFVNSLLKDDAVNVVSSASQNPMHYFMAAIRKEEEIEDEVEFSDKQDKLLQSWMAVNYCGTITDSVFLSKHLVAANAAVRDVTLRDINQLHMILNIPSFYGKTSVMKDLVKYPVVFFDHVYEKIKLMPLHDARLLYDFITGSDGLGIPLFEHTIGEEYPSIQHQWTMLSYFLQMCSPICLSPLEGGHRTMQLIKFFTGAQFNNDTPQPFEPRLRKASDYELKPNQSISEHGVAMTLFVCSFWQRVDKSQELCEWDASQLQALSYSFKQKQDVVYQDTFDGFFVHLIDSVRTRFSEAEVGGLTTNKMFNDPLVKVFIFDRRVHASFPIIVNEIKTQSPFKKQWDKLSDHERSCYDVENPNVWLYPKFDNLFSIMVSTLRFLFIFVISSIN